MKTIAIPVDPRSGKPLVTTEMKIECIGEFWWEEEAPYYDEHGEVHDHVARHAVPWDICKDIYKRMAVVASRNVPQGRKEESQ